MYFTLDSDTSSVDSTIIVTVPDLTVDSSTEALTTLTTQDITSAEAETSSTRAPSSTVEAIVSGILC